MTVKEFYEKHNSDYEGVFGRLMTEARIIKYLRKIDEQGDFVSCMAAVSAGDWETAFRASHSLKGICLNLGLTSLFTPASEFCENLRGGSPKEPVDPMLEALKTEYEATISDINLIEE